MTDTLPPFDHFTSIAPVGISAQVEKLATWHAVHGRPVFTVNHPREIDALRAEIPPWVVPVEAPFTRAFGRDYLPLHALKAGMLAAARADASRYLFTNSDIMVRTAEDAAAILTAPADLAFASRLDVKSDGTALQPYTDGFDVFAFTPAALGVLERDDLALGMPWWDYMVPLFAIVAGHTVRRVDGAAFPHVVHAQRWSKVAYQDIGLGCLKDIAPDLMEGAEVTGATITSFARFTNDILNSDAAGGGDGADAAAVTGGLREDIRRGIRNIFHAEAAGAGGYRPVHTLLSAEGAALGVSVAAKSPATFERTAAGWRLSRNGAPYGGAGEIVAPVDRGGRYRVTMSFAAVGKRLNVKVAGERFSLTGPQTVSWSVFAPHERLTIALDPAEDARGTATLTALTLTRIAAG
ncbi:hypothetical protein ATO13_04360 [Stappia sp. 22II-S9-Z10]|nr:hypothetical protein ATO13_04360 [Stappia sp. 22II-S9-Z10]